MTGTFGIDEPLVSGRFKSEQRIVAMMTLVAVLTFAGALGAAGFAIYATVAPSLGNIQAALAGNGGASSLPPLPVCRPSTLRVSVRPAAQPTYWRAAA